MDIQASPRIAEVVNHGTIEVFAAAVRLCRVRAATFAARPISDSRVPSVDVDPVTRTTYTTSVGRLRPKSVAATVITDG